MTPREDLIRMVPLAQASMRATGDGNTLVGYPIVFNSWTEISGWEGHFLERVDPAAVTKTLAERGDQIKVLFNHGFDPQIGDKPLGKPDVMEPRDFGLWTETPFADTSYNQDLRELVSTGVIDGMSFRFTVLREEVETDPEPSDYNPKGLEERTIKELRLYEFGPVTFPAYEASTAGVRARDAFQAWRTVHPADAAREGTSAHPDTPRKHLSVRKADIVKMIRTIELTERGIR